jgi:hypothetical protein
MEKLFNFIKSHTVLSALVAVGVLLLFFWPKGGGDNSNAVANAAVAATAVAASQDAATKLSISHDQVQVAGLQSASAQAINASNNAAAVAVAQLGANTNIAGIQAELAGLQITANTQKSLAQMSSETSALQTIAQLLPQTQANAIKAGSKTDAAGFSLTEMFKNLLNVNRGGSTTQTLITTDKTGTAATTYEGDSGVPVNTSWQSESGNGFAYGFVGDGQNYLVRNGVVLGNTAIPSH